MKKILMIVASFLIIQFSFASFPIVKTADSATNITIQPKEVSEEAFIKDLTVQDYERLAGRKLNFIERLMFKVEKKRMLKELKKDGKSHFNIWGFLLGLLYGPFGFLAALIIASIAKRPDVTSSAWLGFRIWLLVVAVVLLITLAVLGKGFN